MPPRLSVVVPFYNVADYIGDCLDSLSRQTFEDLDVILVDDGSTDESAEIAREFSRTDPRFRIVKQDNQGLGPARNTGVAHADSEFITFVDSDDLIPRYAYELMVKSLDGTGSSFAAGGARRFNNSSGVRPSYVHRIPFAEDRPATHVLEFPELALDRMVWNKVYRRSFWDQYKYEFPPIRYEDYPVTLQAHIDAVTVDVLSSPVYYWRERESGASITQNAYEYGNLYDRVVSAEMVMDLIDRRAPSLRTVVHTHLAQIDLGALVQAFASTPEDKLADLVELGRRLTGRLNSSVLANMSRYDRLQFRALRTGEVDLLRRLARFQLDGGMRGGGPRARRHPMLRWRYENEYPGLSDRHRIVPRSLYQLPHRDLRLGMIVTNVAWDDADLLISGTAEIRQLRTEADSTLTASLSQAVKRKPITVRRFEAIDLHGESSLVGFEARIPRAMLAAMQPDGEPAKLFLEMKNEGIVRRGYLYGARQGNPFMAPGSWVSDTVWIQPAPGLNAALEITPYRQPAELAAAEFVGESLVVQVILARRHAEPTLVLARHSRNDLVVELRPQPGTTNRFTAEIPLDDLVDPVNPDDPFTLSTVHTVLVASGDVTEPLLATGLAQSVGQVHERRLLTMTRSSSNHAEIWEGPVRLVADELSTHQDDGAVLFVVAGDQRPAGGERIVWRRYVEANDAHIDVDCVVTHLDGRWRATIDAATLTSVEPPRLAIVDPQAATAEWSLYAIPRNGSAYAVQLDPYLTGRLPIEVQAAAGRLSIEPKAGKFHVEVR